MKKGIALIMFANLINLVISLVNGFVLPKYLSIECYALIKTYTLYSTYAGFFHLGYLDGMYLKYGGRDMMSVSSDEYGTDFWNVIFMQIIVCIGVLFVGFICHDFVIKAFAVGLLLRNICSCFQMFFQATGEFKLYSSALNYGTILSFVISLFLVFVYKTDNAELYIGAQVFASLAVSIYLGLLLNSRMGYLNKISFSKHAFRENIAQGFVLMIGNFSNNLFTSIDRWLVKILMTTFHFAAYSFAVSIDSLITVFITPLYVTLYNAFCKNHAASHIINIKRMVLMWGFVIITFAYPAKFVIENYLPKYNDSLPLVFILFATQVFYAVIKGVYVNYFKALRKQNQYFWQIIKMLFVATVSGVTLYLIFKSMMSLAVAALITAIIWLVVNELKFKELRFSCRDWSYLTLLLSVFVVSGLLLPSIMGMLVYTLTFVVTSFMFMRPQFIEIADTISKTIRDKIGKK